MKQAGKNKRVSTPRLPKRRVMVYKVSDLKADIAGLPDDEEIVVVVENEPDYEGDAIELEEGDILNILEAGGYVRGMRVIRARPR